MLCYNVPEIMDIARTNTTLPELAREELLAVLSEHAPKFIAAADKAKTEHAAVMLLVRAFHTQPDLLVVALRYAALEGVVVQFMPEPDSLATAA